MSMILTYLRTEMQPFHRQLEATVDIHRALHSLNSYATLLRRFHGFHAAIEPIIQSRPEWSDMGFDMPARRKLPLLTLDLADLDIDIRECPTIDLDAHGIALSSFPKVLGCVYVIEGSTLGGQLISRELSKIGIGPDFRGRYFASYGPNVGRMWAEFRSMLEHQAATLPHDEIVAGARETFTGIEKWIAS